MWVRIPGDWPVTLTRIKLIQLDLVGLERQMARSNFPEKKGMITVTRQRQSKVVGRCCSGDVISMQMSSKLVLVIENP